AKAAAVRRRFSEGGSAGGAKAAALPTWIVTALVTILGMPPMRSRHGSWLMADGSWRMARPSTIAISHLPLAMALACGQPAPPATLQARNVLLVATERLEAERPASAVIDGAIA